MGRTTRKRRKGRPERAHVGDSLADSQDAGSGGSAASGAGEQGELSEQEHLDVSLVKVNGTTLAETNVGNSVDVHGKQVMTPAGRLGNIPARQLSAVSNEGFDHGEVINTDTVKVRLFK